jgi:hypothetical protein
MVYPLYDPDRGALSGWIGGNGELTTIEMINGWLSPRLGVRFQLVDGELALYHPDGRQFESYVELERSRMTAQLRALGIEPEEG